MSLYKLLTVILMFIDSNKQTNFINKSNYKRLGRRLTPALLNYQILLSRQIRRMDKSIDFSSNPYVIP